MEAKNVGHRGCPADHSQVALIKILKRRWHWSSRKASANHLGGVGASLHGYLRYSWQLLPILPCRKGQVTHHKNVRIVWHRELRRHRNSAVAVGFCLDALPQFSAKRIAGNASGPKNGLCPQHLAPGGPLQSHALL